MSSFLIKKKTSKSFQEKINKLSEKTRSNIHAANKSFGRFCTECYDDKTSHEIFAELNSLTENEQAEALRYVLQNGLVQTDISQN